MPLFNDIPQFPRAHYEVDVPWRYIERHLANWDEKNDGTRGALELSPDYQRAHVWTREQQTAYVEYQLRGGEVGRNVIFNSPDWMRTWERPTELVDGKQRLEAVRAFLRDEFPVFGHLYSEYTDTITNMLTFKFRVCSLETRKEVLQLYLNINAGGTPHTAGELDRVRALLLEAKGSVPAKKKTAKKDSWLAAAADGSLKKHLTERSAKVRGKR